MLLPSSVMAASSGHRHPGGLAAALLAAALLACCLGSAAATCNPFTFGYKTETYYNTADCRTYTLYDIDAGCMPFWSIAKDVCKDKGLELAPHGEAASLGGSRGAARPGRRTCLDWEGVPRHI